MRVTQRVCCFRVRVLCASSAFLCIRANTASRKSDSDCRACLSTAITRDRADRPCPVSGECANSSRDVFESDIWFDWFCER